MQVNGSTHTPITSKALSGKETLEDRKAKLFKASKDLESIFLYHMLQTMRKTVPDNSGGLSAPGMGFGKDMYTQMFDQELASKMAGVGNRSLADELYEDLEKVLERESGIEPKPHKVNTLIENVRKPKNLKIEPIPLESDKTTEIKPLEKSEPFKNLKPIIKRAAEKYNLKPELIESVIKAESGGNPKAVSPAGAKGLMQLMDTTATDVGITDSFDPEQNVQGGAKYLRQMLDRFGDIRTALAAYNAGPGTVQKYGGIPPYKETHDYIDKILGQLETEPVELASAAKE